MSATAWKKITRKATPKERAEGRPEDILLAEPWLEIREGKYRTRYRVRFRQHGLNLEQNLEGEFSSWREAEKVGERLIYQRRFGDQPKDPKAERTETTCDRVTALKKPPAESEATYQQTEIFMRCHLKPFMRGECAYEEPGKPCGRKDLLTDPPIYVSSLNSTHWLSYRAHFRHHNAGSPLFNHAKFWRMLSKFAFDAELLRKPIKLDYNQKRDDARKKGKIIHNVVFQAFLRHANTNWRRRSIVQRFSGQRPGLIRKLRKNQVDLETGRCQVQKGDDKNRRPYEFYFDAVALEQLRQQALRHPNSPYFFPSETDPSQPMATHLNGWHGAWERARDWLLTEGLTKEAQAIDLGDDPFTPHDLRHTHMSELTMKPGVNHMAECRRRDLSLEMWNDVYAHLDPADLAGLCQGGVPTAAEVIGEALG